MATWTYPLSSHPWYRMPSHKRKALESDSSDDSSDLEAYSLPPKRRRCDVLENGFAQLTLDPALQAVQASKIAYNPYTPSTAFQGPLGGNGFLPGASSLPPSYDGCNTVPPVRPSSPTYPAVIHPGSVEEPTSPDMTSEIPEVAMKSRSWYEPEKDRIVIVDLDDSDTEESSSEPSGLHVNSVLLDRLRFRNEPDFEATIPPADSSKALVLFKPVLPPDTRNSEGQSRQTGEIYDMLPEQGMVEDIPDDLTVDTIPLYDDDAMDIEQI